MFRQSIPTNPSRRKVEEVEVSVYASGGMRLTASADDGWVQQLLLAPVEVE